MTLMGRLIRSSVDIIFAPFSSNLSKTAVEVEMQSSLGNFNRHVLALVKHQTSCNCRDAQRHQRQRLHQKKTSATEAAPKRGSFTKSLQTCPCVRPGNKQLSHFCKFSHHSEKAKRNGYFSVANLQLSFSIIYFPHKLGPDS